MSFIDKLVEDYNFFNVLNVKVVFEIFVVLLVLEDEDDDDDVILLLVIVLCLEYIKFVYIWFVIELFFVILIGMWLYFLFYLLKIILFY